MTVEAEESIRTSHDGVVSGAVISVLIGLVRAQSGEGGVAQALALAGEGRPFSALGDPTAWSSLEATVALFNAGALVTGDGAIALHVGQDLLFTPDGTEFVSRLRALGSPAVALKHVTPLVEHFETTSEAVALRVAADHALIRITPRHGATRHAHLCELTRGLLGELPALYGLDPALVTETECSARGGRWCLYALSWDETADAVSPDAVSPHAVSPDAVSPDVVSVGWASGAGTAGAGTEVEIPPTPPTATTITEEAPHPADPPGSVFDGHEAVLGHAPMPGRRESDPGSGTDGLVDAMATDDWTDGPTAGDQRHLPSGPPDPESDRSVAELRAELNRMGVLIEGTFATALELLGDDVESLLSQIAARADAVVTAHRYLLMVRVRPGTPIQLHHRGLDPEEAQHLAAELWREHPDDADGSRLIVDIASPRRRYGRLAEFLPPGTSHPASENRVLNLYAEYAATALDIYGVLTEAKRSDATARTLLSFSDALSRVGTIVELVQVLADTVSAVLECERSTVFLWDNERKQLVPRARCEQPGAPSTRLGSIVPIVEADDTDSTGERRSGPVVPGGDLGVAGNGHHQSLFTMELSEDGGEAAPADRHQLPIRTDNPLVERLLHQHQVIVLDHSIDDPMLLDLLNGSGAAASVVAPLFANGEFLGVVAANFGSDTPTSAIHDPDRHERLAGLADQASTALQNLELLEQVQHMAWHDALTGLPNRRLFEDRVEQELVRSRRVGEPVCMFFVDLDHFKNVNDSLGHSAGDDLIRQVSQRLVDTVRRQDTVARVGGDEFAILLPGLSDQLAIDQLAQRCLEALNTPFLVLGEEVLTSASIGIVMAPDHGDSHDDLLSRADEAMYRAKGEGRNAFQMFAGPLVDSAQGRLAIDERTLYADLIHGLEHNEFFVLYQPYIDLRTAEVVGVEALVRWRHPSLGVLEPASFISMAERSDIIVALDTWVLEQTCRQARAWLDEGLPPLRLSVNLASRDLSNPDLFVNIDRTLDKTGIDPTLLELEITERVVLDRSGPARENIERLRRLGVRFTIDDFGTGNSSLNRIGSFPVSTLKIDQSFVQVLGPDGDKNALVSAIISMADRLGLACVAEGVETSTQSRVLLQRGCTTAQGYFFSPPLPADEVAAMMADIAHGDGPVAPGEAPEEEAG
jgi:diguanylate cyclase (GGDEF)-like protein